MLQDFLHEPSATFSRAGYPLDQGYMSISQNYGYCYHFGGPNIKDCSIIGFYLGVPLFWETTIWGTAGDDGSGNKGGSVSATRTWRMKERTTTKNPKP